jgi:hypothetical protein
MSSITQTNQQYYQGAQQFVATGQSGESFVTTFDVDLVYKNRNAWDPNNDYYPLNNFKIYTSTTGLPGDWSEFVLDYDVNNNTIYPKLPITAGTFVVVQLKTLTGGNYGTTNPEKAFGEAVEQGYGDYEYIKLGDAIDNFMVGYIGDGKIIQTAKKSDVVFFAKRNLQEFSYDTLKSIKSAELTIPPSLSVVIPQDYVNYVKVSWIDNQGVKRPIYPANNLTITPTETPLQDSNGVPTQDNFGENTEGTSITKERWAENNTSLLNSEWANDWAEWGYTAYGFGPYGSWGTGELYGLDPQYSQVNGWFSLDHRDGKMTFSSNLANKIIVLEYISDGLAYDLDTKVPKLAEDALYSAILYSIVSTRANQPEYVVQRLRRERSAKLRNAKIRLSNIKLDEIVQVMRGKSKWIKS